ncbi:MAG TPA: class I SAM-dependent methyltransferase [Polyangiaceae bacterium]|nr:class I SAM-dependent methyltransferase [Polyangiaceae bacterium]
MSDAPVPNDYYEHPRPEVVDCVPLSARNVLDVGCASGALGHSLKLARPEVQVRGVEPVAAQAERARAVLDDVLHGGADDPLPSHWPAPECVIFADVLEHLVDPWSTLRRYRSILKPGGTLVASIPNVAHRVVLRGLFRMRWDYTDFGILDRTHLRFFTRDTAVELVESCGFQIRSIGRTTEGLGRGLFSKKVRDVLAKENGSRRVFPRPLAWLIDAYTVQFLIVAE